MAQCTFFLKTYLKSWVSSFKSWGWHAVPHIASAPDWTTWKNNLAALHSWLLPSSLLPFPKSPLQHDAGVALNILKQVLIWAKSKIERKLRRMVNLMSQWAKSNKTEDVCQTVGLNINIRLNPFLIISFNHWFSLLSKLNFSDTFWLKWKCIRQKQKNCLFPITRLSFL